MEKVIVAISGGVDSSVAAAILKNDLSASGGGYDVIGVFMLMHNKSNPRDAKLVAKKLGIKFKILDVRKEFKKRVIDYFINEYKRGNTPNPCVECNKFIKFKFLLEKMAQLKADFVATGHYARVNKGRLFKGKDKGKDQSYFLWTLKQKQLAKILFPLGDYTKERVRGLAKKFNLPTANKKESQDICFVAPKIKVKKGDILTTDGEKIGTHKGLIFYTIGQRKGLPATPASGLAWRAGIPLYVVYKDVKKNALIVAQSDFNQALFKKEMIVKNVNWINKPKKFPIHCNVKIRYGHKAVPATIKGNKVIFNFPQRAVTPGQSAVFYKNNEVLGGGIIA